jgi:hypothetical protein
MEYALSVAAALAAGCLGTVWRHADRGNWRTAVKDLPDALGWGVIAWGAAFGLGGWQGIEDLHWGAPALAVAMARIGSRRILGWLNKALQRKGEG